MHTKHFVTILLLALASTLAAQTPVSINGKLKLVGLQLSSECGNPVQLRGVSTHGIHWYYDCYEHSAVYNALADNWGADVVRLANYIEDGGYASDPAYWKSWIDAYVDTIGAHGMYCIIDWHILSDGDPNKNLPLAKDFWAHMAQKHAGKKHVLYEICNEPNRDENGVMVPWPTIKAYADTIIPIIRKHDPETVILVGTPTWSGNPWAVIGNELQYPNIMYTFHFYSGTHGFFLPDLKKAASKIPIFASEWGTTNSSGDGAVNASVTNQFMDIFNGNNDSSITISWCNWSFSDKGEGSAALRQTSCAQQNYNRLTASGTLVKSLIATPDRFFACTPKPLIFSDPRSLSRLEGASASFRVKAKGDNLHYQWEMSQDSVLWVSLVGADSSVLTMNNVQMGQTGHYRVRVFNDLDTLTSLPATLTVLRPGPYLGMPIPIPGTVQAEYYDLGFPNKAFRDNTEGNTGGALRTEDVDIEATKDSLGGGYNIGWIDTDEWVKYTVSVADSGLYDFEFRTASNTPAGGELWVEMDGQEVVPPTAIPYTRSWSTYTSVVVTDVPLQKGEQSLVLHFSIGSFNLNYVNVTKSVPEALSKNELASTFALSPNPATATLTVRNSRFDLQGKKLTILDLLGSPVLEAEAMSSQVDLNVSRLPGGVYFLRVPLEGQAIQLKWIKH